RQGVGVELNENFARIARVDLDKKPGGTNQKVIVGDAQELSRLLEPASADFLLTSPPYGSLLKNVKGAFAYKWREHSSIDAISNPAPYSDHPQDLGNLEYKDFLPAIERCLRQSLIVLRPNAYAVW